MRQTARAAVLARHRLTPSEKLGEGGESEVYALDADRVLLLHRQEASAYVRQIGELYGQLDRTAVPYALPEVLEVETEGEVSWSIERRLSGRSFDTMLPTLRGADRAAALTSYVDAAAAFRALGVPAGWEGGCGELFTDELLHAERWGDLLAERLALQVERARAVVGDAIDLDIAAAGILSTARSESFAATTLVHGDWFPGNVLMGDDLQVSAAIDLGWLTVVGDATHDVRTAVVFCEVRPWLRPEDDATLLAAAERHLGPSAAEAIGRTRRYEQLRFAFVEEDEHLHSWCLQGLHRELAT